jgi:hypothetical protein
VGLNRLRPDDAWLFQWSCERCVAERGARGAARLLWLDWMAYAVERGADLGTPQTFRNELRKLGWPTERANPSQRRKVIVGLRLAHPHPEPGRHRRYVIRHPELGLVLL